MNILIYFILFYHVFKLWGRVNEKYKSVLQICVGMFMNTQRENNEKTTPQQNNTHKPT